MVNEMRTGVQSAYLLFLRFRSHIMQLTTWNPSSEGLTTLLQSLSTYIHIEPHIATCKNKNNPSKHVYTVGITELPWWLRG